MHCRRLHGKAQCAFPFDNTNVDPWCADVIIQSGTYFVTNEQDNPLMTTATSTSSSSLAQRQWHPSYLMASTPLSSVSFILPPCQYPVLVHLHTGLYILCAYSMSPLSPSSGTSPTYSDTTLTCLYTATKLPSYPSHQYNHPHLCLSSSLAYPNVYSDHSNLLSPAYYVTHTCFIASGYAFEDAMSIQGSNSWYVPHSPVQPMHSHYSKAYMLIV